MDTPNYIDSPDNFKLIAAAEWAGISRRNIGIFSMWLSGLGIPESFHEFVTAVFITGNWSEVKVDEITLKRMARAISPGLDTDGSIRRAYERLKKAAPKFFEWQGLQAHEIIPRETKGQNRKVICTYKFPHYQLLIDLFHLPERLTQKQIRAEVAKALGSLMLPPPQPRQKRERKPEAVAASNAKSLEELLSLTGSPHLAGIHLSEAWQTLLGYDIVGEIKKVL